MLGRNELLDAAALVHAHVPPTPQHVWPLLNQRTGTFVHVKHENHTPTGAFKARGGVTFIDWLTRARPEIRGIVTATRGNHGQSQARAATAAGLRAVIVVPHGNSPEKNAAMQAFGGEIVTFGEDFDAARGEAARIAGEGALFPVPPFHREIVRGVATCAMELLTASPTIDTLYVPIGCGSGICGAIAARDALGLSTTIVGVVSAHAAAAKLSFDSSRIVTTATADTLADGLAVRQPIQEAFDIYSKGADRIVAVNDEEICEAIRILLTDTHNVAEGAGAAGLAALMQERDKMRGREVAIILTGGNIDSPLLMRILQNNATTQRP